MTDASQGGEVEAFLALERRVWQALVNGDSATDREMLSDDFLGVYPDGFAGVGAHAGQLADGPTVSSFALSDARVRMICPDAALLSYRADYEGSLIGGSRGRVYISSLWERRDGRWINTFSQDTPARADAPAA